MFCLTRRFFKLFSVTRTSLIIRKLCWIKGEQNYVHNLYDHMWPDHGDPWAKRFMPFSKTKGIPCSSLLGLLMYPTLEKIFLTKKLTLQLFLQRDFSISDIDPQSVSVWFEIRWQTLSSHLRSIYTCRLQVSVSRFVCKHPLNSFQRCVNLVEAVKEKTKLIDQEVINSSNKNNLV